MDPGIPIQKPFPDQPMSTNGVYTGPFRAKVKKNDDRGNEDKYLGRIKVWIPQVHGEDYEDKVDELPWAWPCFLHAFKDPDDGTLKAGFFGVPPEDSWVYVIFENGNPDHPIYLGGWYGGEKGDSELDDFFQDDDRSSARYPDIIGYISPHDGKLRFRVLKGDRAELVWCEDDEDKVLIEIDSVGYSPNTQPTVRLDTKWFVKVKSEGKIQVESDDEVKIICKSLRVEAEDKIELLSEGTGLYQASGLNKFSGSQIQGQGTPRGFDAEGR